MNRGSAARGFFLRFILNNILILLLPIVLSVVYYAISIRSLQQAVDATTETQLGRSMEDIDGLLTDAKRMATLLANDYEVNSYLSRGGPFTGIEYYNIKRLSQKIAPYVFGNAIVSHAFLYMARSHFLVFENGFGPYAEVYGSLLSSQGYSAELWRQNVLQSGERIIPDQQISLGGENAMVHLYVRPVGYRANNLGSIVVAIDRAELGRRLADVPDRYGGLVYVQNEEGTLLASTAPVDDALLADDLSSSDYRVYRATSAQYGWRYTALLSQSRLLAGVRAVRTVAFVLIGIGFVAGMLLSFAFANRNAQPIGRVVELVLGQRDQPLLPRTPSVYEEVENAILVLSDSNRRLEDEVRTAQSLARVHFFQNLLRGYYRTRDGFEDDRRLFGITFAPAAYYVIVCRLASLNAARDGSMLARVRQALLNASEDAVGGDDFVVPVSLDDIAIVRACRSGEVRADAMTLLGKLRYGSAHLTAGDYSFGVGLSTSDPYLLVLSYNQSAAAVSSVNSTGQGSVQFYDDLQYGTYSYYYPIDIEENVMRAVRSSNVELLESLVSTIERENFTSRQLSAEQLVNFFVELQGTLLRLFNDLPEEATEARGELATWSQAPASVEKLGRFGALLLALCELYDQRKSSHNRSLLADVQTYVETNFADPQLSLTRIADAFGRSENYLSNFYKEQTGENLSLAIQKARFANATRLLEESDEPIDSVASMCGYANVGSFRRAFKRFHGVSPSDYRARRVVVEARAKVAE